MLTYVMTEDRGATDRLLAGLAARLTREGVRLAGVVQHNVECADDRLCDMDVAVLPDGPTFRISQSLGPEARGCRLDPSALEQAVAAVEARWTVPDLLIVNKFGKHEAGGRGFRGPIARALAEGVPVLTGVNRLNVGAFSDFAEGLAAPGPTEAEALHAHVTALLAREPAA